MTESKIFADSFNCAFRDSDSFLSFLKDRKESSMWLTAPSRSLQFEPIERDTPIGNRIMQIYEHNGKSEILLDTMENIELKCGAKSFRIGDRIIQTKNHELVSNGDMGVITEIHENEDGDAFANVTLLDGRTVCYSTEMMEDVDFSYCISIHKSQGGEFPITIIPLLKEHYVMLRRNLLYTAISRAKSKVIIIGQKQAVIMAIHKNDVDKRNTVLGDRICAYHDRELKRRKVST